MTPLVLTLISAAFSGFGIFIINGVSRMVAKFNQIVPRPEIEDMIENSLAPIKVQLEHDKEVLDRLETKLDKLMDFLINAKQSHRPSRKKPSSED